MTDSPVSGFLETLTFATRSSVTKDDQDEALRQITAERVGTSLTLGVAALLRQRQIRKHRGLEAIGISLRSFREWSRHTLLIACMSRRTVTPAACWIWLAERNSP